jgi:hypothetical protein
MPVAENGTITAPLVAKPSNPFDTVVASGGVMAFVLRAPTGTIEIFTPALAVLVLNGNTLVFNSNTLGFGNG